jgi:hypothetical protein
MAVCYQDNSSVVCEGEVPSCPHAHEATAYFLLGRSPNPLFVLVFLRIRRKKTKTKAFSGSLQPQSFALQSGKPLILMRMGGGSLVTLT